MSSPRARSVRAASACRAGAARPLTGLPWLDVGDTAPSPAGAPVAFLESLGAALRSLPTEEWLRLPREVLEVRRVLALRAAICVPTPTHALWYIQGDAVRMTDEGKVDFSAGDEPPGAGVEVWPAVPDWAARHIGTVAVWREDDAPHLQSPEASSAADAPERAVPALTAPAAAPLEVVVASPAAALEPAATDSDSATDTEDLEDFLDAVL